MKSPKLLVFFSGFILALAMGGCVSLSEDIIPPTSTIAAVSPQVTPTVVSATNTPETSETVDESPAVSPTPAAVEETLGTINVDLLNRGAEGLESAEITVRLEGFDHLDQVYEKILTVKAAEGAEFTDVPFSPGRMFFASVPFQGAVYRSDVTEVGAESAALDLQVEIYGTTTNQSGLFIDRTHIFIDFPEAELVQIGEMFVLSNFGDRTIVAPAPGEPVVSFPLPEGADNLSFQNGVLGDRFIETEDGFGDTASIPPGSGVYQVMVFYDLSYPKSRLTFNQDLTLPVGSVIIMTPVGDVKVKGSGIENLGVRQIQNGSIQVFNSDSLEAGDRLTFNLSGQPAGSPADASLSADDQRQNLLIGLGSLGLVLIGVGIWFYRRLNQDELTASSDPQPENDQQQVLDSIIALDDLYQAEEITEEEYQTRRAELKKQLKDLLELEEKQE